MVGQVGFKRNLRVLEVATQALRLCAPRCTRPCDHQQGTLASLSIPKRNLIIVVFSHCGHRAQPSRPTASCGNAVRKLALRCDT